MLLAAECRLPSGTRTRGHHISGRSVWSAPTILTEPRGQVVSLSNSDVGASSSTRAGRLLQERESSHEIQRGWASASFGDKAIWRPTVSFTRVRSGPPDPRVFDNLDMATLGVSLLARGFEERSYLNNFGRVEDVPLGIAAGVTVGKNFWYRQGLSPDYMVSVLWQAGYDVRTERLPGLRRLGDFLFWGGD